MTPFGERLRTLRAAKGISQKEMARRIGVSPAYLSALEHGKRGVPRWILVQDMIRCLNVIWDEADDLQRLALQSAPKVTIDTSHLSSSATELANLLALEIEDMNDDELQDLIMRIHAMASERRARRGR